MALELPDWLTTAFGVIGLPWPGIDEDTLRDWATGVRQFADDIVDNSSRANQTMRELADSSESSSISAAVGALERHHQLLVELHGPIHDFAEALDIAADAVVAQKWVVIGAATALATEFTATQLGAIFSFGADEAAVPAEVISTRTIVKFALQTLGNELLGKLIGLGAQEVSDHIGASIARMFEGGLKAQGEEQSLKIAYEAVHGVAQEIRGHANTAEDIGNRAHSGNTSRGLADNSGGGGWGEVIKQLERGLLDVAGDLFKSLPGTIAHALRDIADFLEKLVSKFKRADEEGSPAVAAGGAEPAISGTGREPGADPAPTSTGGGKPDVESAANNPAGKDPVGSRPGGGDPVDLATGDVMLAETDVTLPGVLPLVLERTHRSSFRTGRWFGRSWMSSLDQRLLVTADQVIGAFDDGRVLTWTRPSRANDPPEIPVTGPIWPLRRNPDGSYTVSDPQRGLTWRFEHRAGYETAEDGQGELPLVSVTDRIGHEIAFHYDVAGRPLSVSHSGGYRVHVTVTDGRVTGLTLAGRGGDDDVPLRTFEYDVAGNLSGVINSSGLPMRFTYDDAGRMTSWTDRNGYSYRYTFDAEGRCIRGDGPDGVHSGTFTYEPGITRWTDIVGAVTTYEITDSAEVSSIIDPLGNTTRREYDSRGRITTEVDPLGRITRYAYDDRGNLVAITRPDGSQATANYDERSLPVLLTEPDGAVWRQEYDENGNRTLVEAPDGTTARFTYDDRGHPDAVTGPDGTVTAVTCNAAGLPTEVIGPDGSRTRYETDVAGRVVRIAGPDGGITSLGWTGDGRLASRALPDGTAEAWEWDGEGNLIRHVSPSGAVNSWEYGPFDTIATITQPDGARTRFGYDHEQRLTRVEHGGLTWRYEYNPAGWLSAETDYNGAATRYLHDGAGQVTRWVNAAGQETSFRYDPLGNLIAQVSEDAETTFSYDAAARLIRARNADAEIEFERDALGRVIAETCNGRTVRTSYDAAGRVTGRVTPSGTATAWSYDAAGLPTTMTAGGEELRFAYDPSGQEVSRALPGGVTLAQDWDPLGRLRSQTVTGPAGVIASGVTPGSGGDGRAPGQLLQRRSYSYNPDGFVTSIEDLLTGTRSFGLDPSGRVTTVTGTEWQERYAYDPAGNITSASWPTVATDAAGGWLGGRTQGPRQVSGTLITRAGNVRYQHDAAGRVITWSRTRISRKPEIWRYEWDAHNRMVAVTTPDGSVWRYRYDPLGRRIAKLHLDASGKVLGETRFTWDGAVLAEQTEATGDEEQITTWDYQPGSFTPVAQRDRSSPRETANAPQEEIDRRFYAIVTDLTGTPTELLAPNGTVAGYQQHTLWGGTNWHSSGASTPLRFPGQYADPETGLHYNNQRYYDPVTGSYLSPDPLGLSPSPNPHAYVPNPHVYADPLGLMSCPLGRLKGVARTSVTRIRSLFRRNATEEGGSETPQLVYRGGSAQPANLTPRPGTDTTGLSTYDNPEAAAPKGGKVQVIDTSKLKLLQAFPDAPPPGHVSLAPADSSLIEAWAATRGTSEISPFTQDISDAIIDVIRVAKP